MSIKLKTQTENNADILDNTVTVQIEEYTPMDRENEIQRCSSKSTYYELLCNKQRSLFIKKDFNPNIAFGCKLMNNKNEILLKMKNIKNASLDYSRLTVCNQYTKSVTVLSIPYKFNTVSINYLSNWVDKLLYIMEKNINDDKSLRNSDTVYPGETSYYLQSDLMCSHYNFPAITHDGVEICGDTNKYIYDTASLFKALNIHNSCETGVFRINSYTSVSIYFTMSLDINRGKIYPQIKIKKIKVVGKTIFKKTKAIKFARDISFVFNSILKN